MATLAIPLSRPCIVLRRRYEHEPEFPSAIGAVLLVYTRTVGGDPGSGIGIAASKCVLSKIRHRYLVVPRIEAPVRGAWRRQKTCRAWMAALTAWWATTWTGAQKAACAVK